VDAGRTRRRLITLAHALVGWALCAAVIGIGLAVTTLQNALVVHAIAAPLIFFGVTRIYVNRFAFLSAPQTAIVFTGFVVVMDFFVVALVINHSLAMFASLLGTWIPFGLIFVSTLLTGLFTIPKIPATRVTSGPGTAQEVS
jgi:hypothetical protein